MEKRRAGRKDGRRIAAARMLAAVLGTLTVAAILAVILATGGLGGAMAAAESTGKYDRLAAMGANSTAAEDAGEYDGLTPMWVMCKSFVNVRFRARKRAAVLGRVESGEQVWTDGKRDGPYVHVVRLSMESEDGWIHGGYLVDEEPARMDGERYRVCSNGRVALRRTVDGPRRAWGKSGSTLKVYAMGGGWALTNRGYIRTEFIEPDPEG